MDKEMLLVDEVINTRTTLLEKINVICYKGFKRMFDIFFSVIGIIFLLPITVIVKIISICNGDYDSIFFKQERIGLDGKSFNLYKFRSMVPNAEDVLIELLKQDSYRDEWDLNQKFSNDPRITKIGQLLRKTSLDELPQLINILKGDMSLIGPRPLVHGELDSHSGNHNIYESVRPGITGWWACNGRSDIDYSERLKLEYYYIQNCSVALDIKCIFKTIRIVIKKKGAK
ncbi:MAG: sugar transferase [Bacilli bacterium]|nr:sugar transferase [Bacilli bacterium]